MGSILMTYLGTFQRIVMIGQLIGGFFIAFIGLFVYLRNRVSKLYRLFALICLSFSVVLFASYAMFVSTNDARAIFMDRIVYTGVVFVPALVYHFGLVFTHSKLHKKTLYVGYILSFVFFILSQTNLFIDGIFRYAWGVHARAQIMHSIFLVFMAVYIIMFFQNIYSFYKKHAKGVVKEQTRYILIAFLIVAIGGPTGFLPAYGVPLYPFAYFSWVAFALLVAYAIVKHRLMDIRLLVLKSVAYSVVLALIAGAYAFTADIVMQRYKGLVGQNVFNILIIFAAIFGFNPLRRFVERFTDKIFYKGRYDPQKLLCKFSEVMSSTIILDTLTDFILKTLKDEIKIDRVAIVLDEGERGLDQTRKGDFNLPESTIKGIIDLCLARKAVLTDELDEALEARQTLREHNISVLLPLVSEDSLIGVLILGDKKSGDMYTLQDIQFLEILAPEAAIAIKNAELFEEKNMRVRELTALNKLAFSLGTNLNLSAILNGALKQVMLVTQADSGSIMLLDEEHQILTIKASKGLKKEVLKKTQVKVGEGIAGWVAKTREPLILVDDLDPRFQNEQKRQEIISAITVPLKSKERVIGVLSVNRKTSTEIFSKENLDVVVSFAGQLAVAIENAKLYKDLESTFIGTISALAAAVDAKDPYTYGHSNDVMEYAVAIAEQMRLPKNQVETIRIGAALHDIGKIGIDGSILNKPGKLNSEERLIINRHPTIAVNILESLDFLKDTVPLILFHHERYDGKGYPSGIAGEAIPIGARIIAVADSFNAMVSRRPYRSSMSFAAAIKELKVNMGTQFDPRAVDAFLEVLAKAEPKERQDTFSSQRKLSHQKVRSNNH